LCDEPQIPFRYGDYAAIRRNYLPTDYLRDANGFQIEATVFIETEWDRREPVAEMRWVSELRQRTGLPSVAVCHVPLHESRAEELLAQQGAFDFVRGVRHKPRAAPAPDQVESGAPASMSDPVWRRGYAMLERHGFSFDLQTPWWHLKDAAQLNRDFPNTRIILNHTGLPADRSVEGLDAWRGAMREFAAAPNVAVKISGLGERGRPWDRPWDLNRNREIILQTIEIFGEDRCMFASNFPVDRLVGEFNDIYAGYIEVTQALGLRAQAKLFRENARRIYRIDVQGEM
jgi:predicted TIM-barrel fold metal-dependent hydrolase